MSKKMLINATHPEENRVAIVDDGLLTELDIEMAGRELTKGNIYKAAVVRVEPGLQAAFVDYGAERLGFLQAGEIHPEFYPQKSDEKKNRPRINEILNRGQEFLVQIVKEERGTKGAALTTYLSLAGRYMVLVPGSHLRGISRKIESAEERRKIKGVMNSLELPDNVGYIVRTAAMGQTEEELKRDLTYLVRLHENIVARTKQVQAPALIYKESNLVLRSIRDYFTSDMDEVLIDDEKVYQEARLFFQQVMPEYAHLVKLHQERRPVFSRYQIEEQIETITKNKVPLESGGSIVIDTTEALVAIDVNSGKMSSEQGVESTAFKTNIEAAKEAARQLRLRDLGGLVVIDFIDMRDRKHIRDVEKALKDAMHNDKARVSVGRISQFGLLEMSRQRIKAALAEGAYNPCPHCSGSGRVKSVEAQAVAFFRKLQAASAKGKVTHVEGELPLTVADYLLNEKRSDLVELEQRQNVTIVIKGRDDFIDGQIELETSKQETTSQPEEDVLIPLTASPETPSESETTPAQEEQKGESRSSSGRRSRRNRRRRKDEQKPAEQENGGEEASKDVKESSSAENQDAAKTEKPSSQRSRRRGGRRKGGASQTTGADAETSQQPSPEAGAEKSAETAKEKAEQKPAPPATEPLPVEAGKDLPQQESEAEKKPAPKRTRRSPAKKTEAQPAEKGVAESGQDQPQKDAEAEKKPAPKRTRRSPAKKTEAQPAEEGAADSGKDQPQKDAEAEKKPAPKRTRRSPAKKTEAQPAEKGTTESGQDQPQKDADAEKKPTPKRTRRSPAKKTEAQPAEEGAADSGKDQPQKDADAEKKSAPKRTRRSPAKKTEAQPAEEGAADSGQNQLQKDADAEKKQAPKRTRRSPAKTAAEKSPTTKPAGDDTDQPVQNSDTEKKPVKKPARRRRTTKRESETTDESPDTT